MCWLVWWLCAAAAATATATAATAAAATDGCGGPCAAAEAVCGSDGRTLASRCHLRRLQCQGESVQLRHHGPCAPSSTAGGGRKREACRGPERAQFSANLLAIIRAELEREEGGSRDTGDAAVLAWKFSSVDVDGDGQLNRPEYRPLRRLLRKVVQPRRCARTFGRACDADRDDLITRREWVACLEPAYDGVSKVPAAAVEREGGGPTGGKPSARRPGQRHSPTYKIQKTKPALLLQGSVTRVSAHLPGLDEPIDRNKDDTDSNDCLSDRKGVLDEQKSGDTVMYVPECTADGRYQRIQCYRSTGYCWCVNQDSGKPIPGTSIKDQHPRCEALLVPVRPMKGCPEQKKATFLRDLMDLLRNEMVSGTNGTGIVGSSDNLKWQASKEEQIATWSFVILDKNKNKVLERKEWKSFRALVMTNRQLRRCGKKLPRYCDINHDRKISITEWLDCLNAQGAPPGPETSPSPKTSTVSKRKGPNPLESYLKGD